MKAFRNWFKSALAKANKKYELHDPIIYIKEERVWRGALEEVLKQADESNSGGAGLKYRIIINWIKDELKDE